MPTQYINKKSPILNPILLIKQILPFAILNFLQDPHQREPKVENIPDPLLRLLDHLLMLFLSIGQCQHQNFHAFRAIILYCVVQGSRIVEVLPVYVCAEFVEDFCYSWLVADAGPHQRGLLGIVDTEHRESFLHQNAPYFLWIALLHSSKDFTAESIGLLTKEPLADYILNSNLHPLHFLDNKPDIDSKFHVKHFFILSLLLFPYLPSLWGLLSLFLRGRLERHFKIPQFLYLTDTASYRCRFRLLFLRQLVRIVTVVLAVLIEKLASLLAVLLHLGIRRDIVVQSEEILSHFLLGQLLLGFLVQLLIQLVELE